MRRWDTPPNKDTAGPLFDRVFRCSFSRNLTTTDYYIETFGFAGTGVPEIDRTLKDEIIDTYINIDTMLEYHQQDIPIRVHNYDDTKVIYELIQEHLEVWRDRLDRAVNIADAPIEDLIALDKLASSVYDKAKYTYAPEESGSSFTRFLSRHKSLNLSRLNAPSEPVGDVVVGDIEQDKYPHRREMAEGFKSIGIGMRRWK